MRYTTVQVREQLNVHTLAALFWDHLASELDEDAAQDAVKAVRGAYCSREAIQTRVREQLGFYGSRSVDCGPRIEYPEDEVFYATLLAVVARAYRLTY